MRKKSLNKYDSKKCKSFDTTEHGLLSQKLLHPSYSKYLGFSFQSIMVWLDYSIIRISDPIRRRISAESELNQRWFSIFRIRIRFGAKSAPFQRRISADLVLRTVV